MITTFRSTTLDHPSSQGQRVDADGSSDVLEGEPMPLVTCFNLRVEDPLSEIGAAVTGALASMPDLLIDEHEIDFVPLLKPDGFQATVTRINVDLWERSERAKQDLQELATRVARAFQAAAGSDRRVKVVIRPYAVETSGWVSLASGGAQ